MAIKNFARALVVAVLSFGTVASASQIDIVNGLVIVHNRTAFTVHVEMQTHSGEAWEGATLPPGGTFNTVRCCYTAGTEYRIAITRKGAVSPDIAGEHISFRPALCHNKRVPYAYAEFNIHGHEVTRMQPGCYQGPL